MAFRSGELAEMSYGSRYERVEVLLMATNEDRIAELRPAVHNIIKERVPLAIPKPMGAEVERWTFGDRDANLSLLYGTTVSRAQ
jgi:hypothetical protein